MPNQFKTPNSFLFFPHIQKTGGLQIYSSLYKYLGRENCLVLGSTQTGADYSPQDFQKLNLNFSNYKALFGHITIGEAFRNSNFKSFITNVNHTCFSIVRDPVTRIISLYNFIVRWRSHPLSDNVYSLGFEKFSLSMPSNIQSAFLSINTVSEPFFSDSCGSSLGISLFATENINTGLVPFLSDYIGNDFFLGSRNDSLIGDSNCSGIYICPERPYLSYSDINPSLIKYLSTFHSFDRDIHCQLQNHTHGFKALKASISF
jgi:hypothetical protein